jgi:hypothetical protein
MLSYGCNRGKRQAAMTHADVLDQTQHGLSAPRVAGCGWLVNGANLVQGSILSPAMAWGRTGARESVCLSHPLLST